MLFACSESALEVHKNVHHNKESSFIHNGEVQGFFCDDSVTAFITVSSKFFTKQTQPPYPASRGFSLVFLSVVLPFSSRFWLLAFCFGCEPAEEKTSADSRLRFLLNMREMKMRLPWNFCHVSVIRCRRRSLLMYS